MPKTHRLGGFFFVDTQFNARFISVSGVLIGWSIFDPQALSNHYAIFTPEHGVKNESPRQCGFRLFVRLNPSLKHVTHKIQSIDERRAVVWLVLHSLPPRVSVPRWSVRR